MYEKGQARGRKKEEKPAYFGAYVKTRFRKTGLVKSNRETGREQGEAGQPRRRESRPT